MMFFTVRSEQFSLSAISGVASPSASSFFSLARSSALADDDRAPTLQTRRRCPALDLATRLVESFAVMLGAQTEDTDLATLGAATGAAGAPVQSTARHGSNVRNKRMPLKPPALSGPPHHVNSKISIDATSALSDPAP
jgi:hypothetical protein